MNFDGTGLAIASLEKRACAFSAVAPLFRRPYAVRARLIRGGVFKVFACWLTNGPRLALIPQVAFADLGQCDAGFVGQYIPKLAQAFFASGSDCKL